MRTGALPVAIAICVLVATIQMLPAQQSTFDVISIRPNLSTANAEFRMMPNGQFIARNLPLRSLILRAYQLHDSQLIGAPAWIAGERFDIDAKTAAPPAGGPDALMTMLRPLLVERFNLRTHAASRELPAYALVVARRDRRLGSQLRATEADCDHASTLTQEQLRASVRDGWPPCGATFTVAYSESSPTGNNLVKMRVRRSGTTMRDFAASLQDTLDRPVVDATDLDGRFDIEYSHAPKPPSVTSDSVFGPDAPMLFAALEEQLGLKLESRLATVPVLVVDAVEHPEAN